MTRAITLGAVLVALAPSGATAHALDEYVQASRLSLTRTHVGLEIDLTPGGQIAAPIIRTIDRDGDGLITPAEAAAYGARVLADAVVELDGDRVVMKLTRIEIPPPGEMREGAGTIHLSASGSHGARLIHRARLSFRNNHAPDVSVYSVNALVPADRALSVSSQDRDARQRSARILYDVRPLVALQIGWVAFALLTSLAWGLARKPRNTVSHAP